MDIILSKDCIKQLKILEKLMRKNNDFENLYSRISLIFKSFENSDNIDGVQLGIRDHGGAVLGRLKDDLSDVVSRDVDAQHRVAAFEIAKNAMIVTSITHYNVKLYDGRELFTDISDQMEQIRGLPISEFEEFKKNTSKPVLDSVINSVNGSISKDDIEKFNKVASEINICPMTVETVKYRLTKFLKTELDNQNKLEDSLLNFFSNEKNIKFLERSTVNARTFSNVAADVLSEGNLKDVLMTKLDIDRNMYMQFSDFVCYTNRKLNEAMISVDLKEKIISDIAEGFLKAFDNSHNKTIELENADLCSFDFRHDYEIIRRMDEHLKATVKLDLERTLKKDPNFLALDHNKSKELYKYLFPQTEKAIATFCNACRKLNLLPNGKSVESHEAVCKKLGIEKASLLKRKDRKSRIINSKQNNQEVSKIKKERRIKKGHSR